MLTPRPPSHPRNEDDAKAPPDALDLFALLADDPRQLASHRLRWLAAEYWWLSVLPKCIAEIEW